MAVSCSPFVFTDAEREAAADALRRYEQSPTVLWRDLPNATRKKWLSKIDAVTAAVLRERDRVQVSTD